MEILFGIAAAIVAVVVLSLAGHASLADGDDAPMTQLATHVQVPVAPDELVQRLQKLADSEPPARLSLGAMCHDTATPPDRFDYACPACARKTTHARIQGQWPPLAWEVEACRRLVKTVMGLDIELTETGFCATCHPDAKRPVLGIRIRYPNKKAHEVAPIGSADLQLLAEFMAGERKHDAGQQGEKPLRDYKDRLAKLLGTGPIR